VTDVRKEVVIGTPDEAHICASDVERQHLTMWMSMRRHSKEIENCSCAVALHFMHFNFCRKRPVLWLRAKRREVAEFWDKRFSRPCLNHCAGNAVEACSVAILGHFRYLVCAFAKEACVLRTYLIRLIAFICAVLLTACGTSDPQHSESGYAATVVLAITSVPSDVSCIEVSVTGSQSSTQRFDVTPSQSASLSLIGLPSGAVTIYERAFAVGCSQVTASSIPTWVAVAPAAVALVAGQASTVTIVLGRPSQIQITNDFQDTTATPLTFTPSPLAFGNVTVGTTSTLAMTIKNTGTSSTVVPTMAGGGSDISQFGIMAGGGTTCSPGTTSLAAGASCTLQVAFAPTSAGAKSAMFTFGGSPAVATVTLTGTAVASTTSS
jgi:hypothetical protein